MKKELDESGWKQHFPTYYFKRRDVALEEYRVATKTLEIEERVFLNAANLAVLIAVALGSLALGSLDKLVASFGSLVPEPVVVALVLLFAFGFALLTLRYFADRQKAVVFAARKVIVLRRMLGMNYGSLQLVLPNWRIEGADEPFAIRLFPGWNTYVAYPCYAIAGIVSAVALFLCASLLEHLQPQTASYNVNPSWLLAAVAAGTFAVLSLSYRTSLVDTHERVSLLIAQKLAGWLRLTLVSNIEYVIYRATLAAYELRRLGIELSKAKTLLVHIEDKEFFSHSGVSMRGLGRLLLAVVGQGRRSGGSTITQQLVRTLFIEDQTKLVRRKVVEILLARWFDKVFAKNDQLEIYLASVRYEAGVFGLPAAMKHFFGSVLTRPSPAELFLLIERVSNVRSRLLVAKVDQTLRRVVSEGMLGHGDAREVVTLYAKAVASGNIKEGTERMERLKKAWSIQEGQ